ncbi:MAG: PEP-CTERM sorting domain-containing protein, partial [Thiotrichaceae bacterium]|nr:PEP-CTERM sorting domain-containing protein [Thiotrichaceae bacterium]
GFSATKAAVFNTIDHGPLPGEAIESTVYLSNDKITWTQGVTERVWLEGIYSDTSVLWDGFGYAVGTGTNDTFRYASVIWGGPGALISDGDNEINAIMGLTGDFTQHTVPEPSILALFSLGLAGLGFSRRRKLQS